MTARIVIAIAVSAALALVACDDSGKNKPDTPAPASADARAAKPSPDAAARPAPDATTADAAPAATAPQNTAPRARWPELSLGPGETAGGVLDKLQLTPPQTTPVPGPDGVRRSEPTRWVSKSGHAVLVSIASDKTKVALRAQWFDSKSEPRVQNVVTIEGAIDQVGEPYISDFANGELVVVLKLVAADKKIGGKHAFRMRFDPKRGFKIVKRAHYQRNDRGSAEDWIMHGGKELAQAVFPRSTNARVQSLRSYYWRDAMTKLTTVAADGAESTVERPIADVLSGWARLGALPTMPYEWTCDQQKNTCCESKQAKVFEPFWHIDRVCFARAKGGLVFGAMRVREPR